MPPENRPTLSFLRSARPSSSRSLSARVSRSLRGDAVIGGVEGENFADPEAAVQVAHLGDHGDALLDADGIAGDVRVP